MQFMQKICTNCSTICTKYAKICKNYRQDMHSIFLSEKNSKMCFYAKTQKKIKKPHNICIICKIKDQICKICQE